MSRRKPTPTMLPRSTPSLAGSSLSPNQSMLQVVSSQAHPDPVYPNLTRYVAEVRSTPEGDSVGILPNPPTVPTLPTVPSIPADRSTEPNSNVEFVRTANGTTLAHFRLPEGISSSFTLPTFPIDRPIILNEPLRPYQITLDPIQSDDRRDDFAAFERMISQSTNQLVASIVANRSAVELTNIGQAVQTQLEQVRTSFQNNHQHQLMVADQGMNLSEDSSEIWSILESITSKNRWYEKVFDDLIIGDWLSEIRNGGLDDEFFWMALRILRASAQGMRIDHDHCDWESFQVCDQCRAVLSEEAWPLYCQEEADHGPRESEDFQDWLNEHIANQDSDYCQHARCTCLGPDSDLQHYLVYLPGSSAVQSATSSSESAIEGPSAIPDSEQMGGLLSEDLRSNLRRLIERMCQEQPVVWHPGSNQQVRDIIHPSWYPYVKGVSALSDGTVEPVVDEKVRYAWLPSQFEVDSTGQVKLDSYINNLHPNYQAEFVPLIEQTLTAFLPRFEQVLRTNLKSRQIQIIVKVASTELDATKPQFPGGSWHLEGMPHERIIATGIHYLTIEGITDSFLEFRKPVIINEENCDYPQSDSVYTSHHYGITEGSHFDGQMNRYLGLIKSTEGASVIFPNILQHHVKDFQLADDPARPGQTLAQARRIILAFFLIDPDRPIISTANVLPQQASWNPPLSDDLSIEKSQVTFTQEEMEFRESRLMYHRKYYVNEINQQVFERAFSLCEH